MIVLIDFLSRKKSLNCFLLFIYFLCVVLPHEQVGLAINAFFSRFPRAVYNQIILTGSIVLLAAILLFLIKRIWRHPNKFQILFFWAFTIFLIFIVNSNLFVINIESIHYVQYALFAFLCFPVFSNYYVTLFWSTLAGALDEAYQYFILAPERTDYFDINDIITNFLGVCCGLLILKSWPVIAKQRRLAYELKWILPPLTLGSGLLVGLILSPILSVYPSDDKFQLVRIMPEGFWSAIPKSSVYHVVLPMEGAAVMILLFFIYFFCFHNKDANNAN